MFRLVITERSGAQSRVDLDRSEVRIGRLKSNDVVLPRENVSKRHCQLIRKDGRTILIDLRSTNGTYVNGRKITSPLVVRPGDKIYVGDFILGLEPPEGGAQASERRRLSSVRSPAPGPRAPTLLGHPGDDDSLEASPDGEGWEHSDVRSSVSPPGQAASAPPQDPFSGSPTGGSGSLVQTQPPDASDEVAEEEPSSDHTTPFVFSPPLRLQQALRVLMEQLAEHLDVDAPQEGALPERSLALIEEKIEALAGEGVLSTHLDRNFLAEAAACEAVGLGPLDRLLTHRDVREIVVDAPTRILTDMGHGLTPVSAFFSSERALHAAVARLMTRAGTSWDDQAPLQEACLPDGSHLQVLSAPLVERGPVVSVRRPDPELSPPAMLVADSVLSSDMLEVIAGAFARGDNLLVSGAAGSGVSSFLSSLLALGSERERVAVVERWPGVTVDAHRSIRFRRGVSQLPFAELLRQAARLRCDRLVIDDAGAEAGDAMLEASGRRGVLLGLHAGTPAAALARLELSVSAAPSERPAVLALVAASVQLHAHLIVTEDGARRVASLTEIQGARSDGLRLRDLYRYDDGFHRV